MEVSLAHHRKFNKELHKELHKEPLQRLQLQK
jgi:hypothetical protein